MGKPVTRAILDGAQQIAMPAFVSTLCICIVFVPVVFITGVARYLFTPLALAVVFAMLASYFLSRTVVPTMVHYLLPAEAHLHRRAGSRRRRRAGSGPFTSASTATSSASQAAIAARSPGRWTTGDRGAARSWRWSSLSLGLFPAARHGLLPHRRRRPVPPARPRPAGTRIEETERSYAEVEAVIRETIPADEIEIVIDNIGIPGGGVNLAFSDASIVSAADGEILVALNPEQHGSTAGVRRAPARRSCAQRFPDLVLLLPAGRHRRRRS